MTDTDDPLFGPPTEEEHIDQLLQFAKDFLMLPTITHPPSRVIPRLTDANQMIHGLAASLRQQRAEVKRLQAALTDVIHRAMDDPESGTRLFGCGAAEHYRDLLPASPTPTDPEDMRSPGSRGTDGGG